MRVLPGPTRSNTSLAWSPDSRYLAAGGSGDGVMVWEVDAGTPGQRLFPSARGGRLLQFCPRTGRLYVAFQTGGFWHWDPTTDEEHHHRWSETYAVYFGMAVSHDGRTIVVSTFPRPRTRAEWGSRAITAFTIADDGTMRQAWSRRSNWADAFAFRAQTGELFGYEPRIGSGRPGFEWIDPEAWQIVGACSVPPDSRPVKKWALAPNGEEVAWIAERGGFVRPLTDPGGSDAIRELPAAEGELRRGLAWSPDSRTIAYTTGTMVRLLDATTLTELRSLDWNTGKARAVAFSPDGLRCAVSGEGGRGWVTVFDLE